MWSGLVWGLTAEPSRIELTRQRLNTLPRVQPRATKISSKQSLLKKKCLTIRGPYKYRCIIRPDRSGKLTCEQQRFETIGLYERKVFKLSLWYKFRNVSQPNIVTCISDGCISQLSLWGSQVRTLITKQILHPEDEGTLSKSMSAINSTFLYQSSTTRKNRFLY